MDWTIKTFDELSLGELYGILQARCGVFVEEQNCSYLDPDGLDQEAVHLFKIDDGNISAYCRLLKPGEKYQEASIGRVLTTKGYRREGYGKILMATAIQYVQSNWRSAIRISGQAYLRRFYENLGFRTVSEEYLEDGIPHIEMLLPYTGGAYEK